MSSREKFKEPVHEKLQLLRSITNSHAITNRSILEDATRYIKDLKQKVETLHQDLAVAQTSSNQNSCEPVVTVETLDKGFLVNVYLEKKCPGLLVLALDAFEELGLNVVEARISCTHSFHLEANKEGEDTLSDQVVKQTILEAIKNWNQSNQQD